MLGAGVRELVDLHDHESAPGEGDLLAAAGGGGEGRGEEAAAEFAALAEAAGFKIEPDGDGGEDGALLLAAEGDGDAVGVVRHSGGAVAEGFNSGGGHAGAGVSKKENARWKMSKTTGRWARSEARELAFLFGFG